MSTSDFVFSESRSTKSTSGLEARRWTRRERFSLPTTRSKSSFFGDTPLMSAGRRGVERRSAALGLSRILVVDEAELEEDDVEFE